MAEPLDESERYFASSVTAMLAEGYTAQRLRWLITCSQINFRHDAAAQDRPALHVVDDGPSDDGAQS
jgi:hypothetical protein